MTRRADAPLSRADFYAASGVLLVKRAPPLPIPPAPGQPPMVQANPLEGDEILLAVWDDGSVTALHGHVDLGTGIRTALHAACLINTAARCTACTISTCVPQRHKLPDSSR